MFQLGEDEALEAFEQALLEKQEGEPCGVLIACMTPMDENRGCGVGLAQRDLQGQRKSTSRS